MTNNRAKYFFLMPGVCWILAFTLFPLVYSFGLSMTNYRLGKNPKYIGFENYAEILGIGDEKVDKKAVSTASFSAFLFIGSTATTLIFGTFVAWVFNHGLPFLKANAGDYHNAYVRRAYRCRLVRRGYFQRAIGTVK